MNVMRSLKNCLEVLPLWMACTFIIAFFSATNTTVFAQSDTVATPYSGEHQIKLSGNPTFGSADPIANQLVRGGVGGELDAGQLSENTAAVSNYDINPADLSGNVDLDWTWDLSHIGIDLSPIGGPDWDLGTWGIEPIAVAYAGTQIDLETQFFAEGNEVASAVQIDVDIPIELTYSIPEYEKGENLVVVAKSWIPQASAGNPHVNFVNGDFSKDLQLHFGVGSEIGVDVHLGPFGELEPRILQFDFDTKTLPSSNPWSLNRDGISLLKANKHGFSGELGLVARPLFMDINNRWLAAAADASSLANTAISSINDFGSGSWAMSFDANGSNTNMINNFLGKTLGLDGSSFDLVGELTEDDANLSSLYCMYKVFNAPIGFDLPDLSNLLDFSGSATLNFNLDIDGFEYSELYVTESTKDNFTHPGYAGNPVDYDADDWLTDWAFYQNTDQASYYVYQDEEEPLLYYSNVCMANNDDNDENPTDDNALVADNSLKSFAAKYGFTSERLKEAAVNGANSPTGQAVKASSMVMFKRIAQYVKMPAGRSKSSNTTKANKAPSVYKRINNARKVKSNFDKYKKAASRIPAWMIFCEPTVDAIEVMQDLFADNYFANSFIGATGSLLDEVHLKEPSAEQWFTTAPQLDLVDNFGVSMTARSPSTEITGDNGLYVTQTGYSFRSSTVETSEWLEIRHNYFDTFEQVAQMYCPVLAPTPPCAALVALEMRKSEDNDLLEQYLPAGQYDKSSGKIDIFAFSGDALLGPIQSMVGMVENIQKVINCADGSALNPGGAESSAESFSNSVIDFFDWGSAIIGELELLRVWVNYNILDAENKFSLSNQFDASMDVQYEYRFDHSAPASTNPKDSTLSASLKDGYTNTGTWYSASQLREGVSVELPTNCSDETTLKVIARIKEGTNAHVRGADRIADSLLYNMYNFEVGIDPVTIIPSFSFDFPCVGSIEEFAESLGSCAAYAVVEIFNWFCRTFGGSDCFSQGECKTCNYGFPGLGTPGWSKKVGNDGAKNLITVDDEYIDETKTGDELEDALDISWTVPDGSGGENLVNETEAINQEIVIDELVIPANVFALEAVDVFRSPGYDDNKRADSTVISKFQLRTTLTQLTGTFEDYMVPDPAENYARFTSGETNLEFAGAADGTENSVTFVGQLPTSVYGQWGVQSPSGCNATILDPIDPVAMPISLKVPCNGGLPDGETWPDGSSGCFCADEDEDMCNDCAHDENGDPLNDGQVIYKTLFDGTILDGSNGLDSVIISDGDFDNDGMCDFGDPDDDNDGTPDFLDPEDFNALILGDLDDDGQEDGWCSDYNNSDLSGCDTFSNPEDASTNNTCLNVDGVRYVRCKTLDFDKDLTCDYNDLDADGDLAERHPDAEASNGNFEAYDTNANDLCDLNEIVDSIYVDTTEQELAFIRFYDCNDLNTQECYSLDNDACDDCSNTQITFETQPDGTNQFLYSNGPNSFNDGDDFDRDGMCDFSDPDDDNDGVVDGDEPVYFGVSMSKNPMFCDNGVNTDTDVDSLPCDACIQNWLSYATAYLNSHLLNKYNANAGDYTTTNIKDATLAIWDGEAVHSEFSLLKLTALTDAINSIELIDPLTSSTFAVSSESLEGDSLKNLAAIYGANNGLDDYDSDGICNSLDNDIDGDGCLNLNDWDDFNEFSCRDFDRDGCDDCSSGTDNPSDDGVDYDGDGLCDNVDFNGDSLAYHLDLDIDGDGRLDGRLEGVLDTLLLHSQDIVAFANYTPSTNKEFIFGKDTVTLNLSELSSEELFGASQKDFNWHRTAMQVNDPNPYDNHHCGDLDFDECDDCLSSLLDPWNDGPNMDYDNALTLAPGADLESLGNMGADSLNDYHWELYKTESKLKALPQSLECPTESDETFGVCKRNVIVVQWNAMDKTWHADRSNFFDFADSVALINDEAKWWPKLTCINPNPLEPDTAVVDSTIIFDWDKENMEWIDSDTAGSFDMPSLFYNNFEDGDTLSAGDTFIDSFLKDGVESDALFNSKMAWVLNFDSLALRKVFGDMDADGDGLFRTFIYDYNEFANLDEGNLGKPVIDMNVIDYIEDDPENESTLDGLEANVENHRIVVLDGSNTLSRGFHSMVLKENLYLHGAVIGDVDPNESLVEPFPSDLIRLDESCSECLLFGVVQDYFRKQRVSSGDSPGYTYYNAFICLYQSDFVYARRIKRELENSPDSAEYIVAQSLPSPVDFEDESQFSSWVLTKEVIAEMTSAKLRGKLTQDSSFVQGFEFSVNQDLTSPNEVLADTVQTITSYNMFESEITGLDPHQTYYYRAFASDTLPNGSPGAREYGEIKAFQTFSDEINMAYQANEGVSENGLFYELDPAYPSFRNALIEDQINAYDFINVSDTLSFDINDQNSYVCYEQNGFDRCADHSGSYVDYEQNIFAESQENGGLQCVGWFSPIFYKDLDLDGLGDGLVFEVTCSPTPLSEDGTEGVWVIYNGDECDDLDACNYDDINNSACTYNTWYLDDDGDGYGDPNVPINTCDQPDHYVSDNTDSDDADETVH